VVKTGLRPFFRDELFVVGGGEQSVSFSGVAEGQLDDPGIVGVLIDLLGG